MVFYYWDLESKWFQTGIGIFSSLALGYLIISVLRIATSIGPDEAGGGQGGHLPPNDSYCLILLFLILNSIVDSMVPSLPIVLDLFLNQFSTNDNLFGRIERGQGRKGKMEFKRRADSTQKAVKWKQINPFGTLWNYLQNFWTNSTQLKSLTNKE